MRGEKQVMRKGVILLSGILVVGALLFLYPVRVLTLLKNHEVIFCRAAEEGTSFELAYLHSVARSDVREFFQIDPEYRIVLIGTRFQGQGTGIPYGPAEGEQIHREGDWFHLKGMHRVLPSISWTVQSQSHNRFRFGNDPEFDLSARMGDALITIQVQKVNLASYVRTLFLSSNFS